MPFLSNKEQDSTKNEIALKKLIHEIDNLKEETDKMFQELQICPVEFASFLQNPKNFTEQEWNALQQQRKDLDQTLSISHNANPLETKKAFNELHMSRNWLFVK